jgi:periplasmic protein TonB
MSSEERVKAELCTGTFSGCLVEGDTEENARERKIKRRAVGISVVVQSAALAIFVIAPLFAKPAELVGRNVVPIPPYAHHAAQQHAAVTPPGRPHVRLPGFFQPDSVPVNIQTHDNAQVPGDAFDHNANVEISGDGSSTGPLSIADSRRQPPPPDVPPDQRVVVGHIDPALLLRRVEPVFPALARQTRRSGKVELHALIGTDGSVQALSVVSGDPLFVNSALDAVRQWHYRPTYLNGNAVEVDTYITVIYTLQQ